MLPLALLTLISRAARGAAAPGAAESPDQQLLSSQKHSTAAGVQVVRQPPGTYTAREHSARVAPLFLEPLLAWAAHALAGTALHMAARRDAARLGRLQSNLRKMVAELKACAMRSALRHCSCEESIDQWVWASGTRPGGSQGAILHGVVACSSREQVVVMRVNEKLVSFPRKLCVQAPVCLWPTPNTRHCLLGRTPRTTSARSACWSASTPTSSRPRRGAPREAPLAAPPVGALLAPQRRRARRAARPTLTLGRVAQRVQAGGPRSPSVAMAAGPRDGVRARVCTWAHWAGAWAMCCPRWTGWPRRWSATTPRSRRVSRAHRTHQHTCWCRCMDTGVSSLFMMLRVLCSTSAGRTRDMDSAISAAPVKLLPLCCARVSWCPSHILCPFEHCAVLVQGCAA